jgi:hypothetical protein
MVSASLHHLIDRIGPVLGIVAFLGLAILTFLLFQEAREVRRLRDWAGRAPERAAEAADAALAAAEARGEVIPVEKPSLWRRAVNGLAAARGWVVARVGPPLRELDRRFPVDPKIALGVIVAGVAVAAALTSGFGLVGGGGDHAKARLPKSHTHVAVLNGTQEQAVVGVPGLASMVAHEVVKPAGYRLGPVANAPDTAPATVVMYAKGRSPEAKALATAIQAKLGKTGTKAMTAAVRRQAKKAPLALVIGLDDQHFGAQAAG